MAIIKKFKATRPTRDKVNLVASRSYLSYSNETLKEKLNNNPYTFLHIINPDYDKKTKLEGNKKFKLVKKKFSEFIEKKILIEDDKEYLYIYQQIKNNNKYTGIIAATSVDDYLNGKIKIHEQTLNNREKMFKDYLNATGFNAEPVLLTYKDNKIISSIINNIIKERSEYEFSTTNEVLHKLWRIDNKEYTEKIISEFRRINKIYIADGHHRTSSSAILCEDLRKNKRNYNPKENYNFFMSYLIPESNLNIINYNRLIRNVNRKKENEIIQNIKKYCIVINKGKKIYSPTKNGEISMYFMGNWYSIFLNHQKSKDNTTSVKLDTAMLSKKILSPVFDINDERTDKNINFIEGTISLNEIKIKVDNGDYDIAFIIQPISINTLKEVADRNEVMPPKSTYIEPKLRSGITIYKID